MYNDYQIEYLLTVVNVVKIERNRKSSYNQHLHTIIKLSIKCKVLFKFFGLTWGGIYPHFGAMKDFYVVPPK